MGRVTQAQLASRRAAAKIPASRPAAIALAVLAVLILAGSLILYALTHQNLAENGGQAIIVFASCVTVGLIIAWHRPGNPIGWLILAAVNVQGLGIDGSVYATLARRRRVRPPRNVAEYGGPTGLQIGQTRHFGCGRKPDSDVKNGAAASLVLHR